jgi:hypothetical protein
MFLKYVWGEFVKYIDCKSVQLFWQNWFTILYQMNALLFEHCFKYHFWEMMAISNTFLRNQSPYDCSNSFYLCSYYILGFHIGISPLIIKNSFVIIWEWCLYSEIFGHSSPTPTPILCGRYSWKFQQYNTPIVQI